MFSGIKQRGKRVQLKRASSCVHGHASVKALSCLGEFSSALLKGHSSEYCAVTQRAQTRAEHHVPGFQVGFMAQKDYLDLLFTGN